jgi:hypothetical protein
MSTPSDERFLKTLFTAEKCVFTQKSFVNSSKKRIFAAEKCVFTQKSNVKLNQLTFLTEIASRTMLS